jgi:DNA primase
MDVYKELSDRGIDFQESGGNRYMLNCPFHDDNNPSCGVWKDSGYFLCFGCGARGSFTELIAELDGVSFDEAHRSLRSEDNVSTIESKIRRFLDEDVDALKFFNLKSFLKVYPKLKEGDPGWQYLLGRGITPESIHRFRMREGTKRYHGRVVLPIFTPEGKLLSYVGRAINPDVRPKTIKSRSPHRTFYGIFEILRDSRVEPKSLSMVIVEGEFDAVYLQQFGIPAVSNMGTTPMTPYKIRILRRYAKRAVLSFDGDDAGYHAMYGDGEKRRCGIVHELRKHLPVTVVDLPDGKDPNELSAEDVIDLYGKYSIQGGLYV